MDRKICWLDLETTGLDAVRHGVIQIAGFIEVNGSINGVFDFHVRPFPDQVIDLAALAVNGMPVCKVEAFPVPFDVFRELVEMFSIYVDRWNASDRMFFAGYHAGFDERFLREFFRRCGDERFDDWFARPALDVAVIAMDALGGQWNALSDHKLQTVAQYLDVCPDGRPHDALCDAKLAMDVYRACRNLKG